jgi:hypothetical protein
LPLTKKICDDEKPDFEIARSKGIYPYEWMDSKDKFDATSLPAHTEFKSTLKGEVCSDEDYKTACNVWEKLGCKTFRDYHDFYLTCDVYLLADVFENFRTFASKPDVYGMDPAHAFTTTGYSWREFLKMTRVKIDLLSDMYMAFEQAKRGGVCVVSDKMAESNAPEIWNPQTKAHEPNPDFDSSKPIKHVRYDNAKQSILLGNGSKATCF